MENWAKPRTRHTNVHGRVNGVYVETWKKTADARRGRNGTRAMENWAKPCTRHTHVHGPLHGPVNGLYVDTRKNGRRSSGTERDAPHGKLGKTMYDAHTRTRTRERAVRGHGKKRPTPVVDGTGRAPWKTGQNHVRGTHTCTDPYTDP